MVSTDPMLKEKNINQGRINQNRLRNFCDDTKDSFRKVHQDTERID